MRRLRLISVLIAAWLCSCGLNPTPEPPSASSLGGAEDHGVARRGSDPTLEPPAGSPPTFAGGPAAGGEDRGNGLVAAPGADGGFELAPDAAAPPVFTRDAGAPDARPPLDAGQELGDAGAPGDSSAVADAALDDRAP